VSGYFESSICRYNAQYANKSLGRGDDAALLRFAACSLFRIEQMKLIAEIHFGNEPKVSGFIEVKLPRG